MSLFSAQKGHAANEVFLRHGATSIPGTVKALWNPATRGETLKAVGNDLAFGGGAVGTAMMGLGGYDTYKSIRGDVQPGQENMGYGERVGRAAGNAAGWLLPSPVPVAGQLIGGGLLGSAFGGVGSVVDKVVGNKAPSVRRPPLTDPTDPVASTANQLGGVQHTMSASAAGKPYGGGMEQ